MPHEFATFGGGCFWCTEAVFEQLKGVNAVVSGYTGGAVPNPTYEQVCGKKTGHAEVIRVEFDPSIIPYRTLVELFFAFHDPTKLNQQGHDIGPQYRSSIFFHSAEQESTAKGVIAELDAAETFPSRIVTEVTAASQFYPAEEYHQGFFRNNPSQPYCRAVALPKVLKLRKQYGDLMKG